MNEQPGCDVLQNLERLCAEYHECLMRFLSRSNLEKSPEAQDLRVHELQQAASRISAEVGDGELQLALAFFERPEPSYTSSHQMLWHVQTLKNGRSHQYEHARDGAPRAVDLVFEHIAPGPLHDFFCTANRLYKTIADCSSPQQLAEALASEAARGTNLPDMARQAATLRQIELPQDPNSREVYDPVVWKMTVDKYITSELLFVEALVDDVGDQARDQDPHAVEYFRAVACERCWLLAPFVICNALVHARSMTQILKMYFGESVVEKLSEPKRRELMFMIFDAGMAKAAKERQAVQ